MQVRETVERILELDGEEELTASMLLGFLVGTPNDATVTLNIVGMGHPSIPSKTIVKVTYASEQDFVL